MKKVLFLSVLLFFSAAAYSQPFLRLSSLFGDGMVLQAEDMVTVWGWADPNTEVTVETSWGEKTIVKSDYSSLWKARVRTPSSSFNPESVTVRTKRGASRIIHDILIGQVWLCTGQSNMNWSAANGIKDAAEAVRTPDPSVRLFSVPKKASVHPQDDIDGIWAPCDSANAWWFSAVGYFFGRELAARIGQPVGLINASWGGTPVEVWIPRESVSNDSSMMSSWETLNYSKRPGWDVGAAYNGMIAPLENFACAGAIWYQGESNRKNAALYAKEFSLMITQWRKSFGRDLPFYFVQIAPRDTHGADDMGALVREQQEFVAKTVRKTGMVNIADQVEDLTDIHPKYKKVVGERLAAYAISEVYGQNIGKYKSPSYASMEVKKNLVTISFDNAEGGLVCNGDIRGLEIGDGSAFYPAQGMIQGDKMVVWSKQVRKPVAVRYCFGLTVGNVFDSAGNPLLPFRSDNPLYSKKDTAPVLQASPENRIIVSSTTSEVRVLNEGCCYFTNRTYPVTVLPKSLSGKKFVSHEGISKEGHHLTIMAPQGGTVTILARNNKYNAAILAGWAPDPTTSVTYTTKDPSKPGIVVAWTKTFKKGETVTLEGNDFAGYTVVAPEIELK